MAFFVAIKMCPELHLCEFLNGNTIAGLVTQIIRIQQRTAVHRSCVLYGLSSSTILYLINVSITRVSQQKALFRCLRVSF